MADQTEPQESRRFVEQPLNADNQAGQGATLGQSQQFVAPAESFGSFGPLPNYPTQVSIPSNGPQYAPAPLVPANAPAPALNNPYAPAPLAANPYAYPTGPIAGNPYMPGTPPYLPYGMYPPIPVPVKTKKPLLFPLTRKASVLLQIFGILLYSLLVALGIMGCILTLLRAAVTNGNVYANPDGSANGLSIVITIVLLLLLIPASSLFSGAFFGSWRGLIVSVLSLGGGVLLAHVSDSRFGNPNAPLLSYLPFVAPIITALVVGFVYDRRKYAAWWKSMLTMFLGTAVLLIWLFAFTYLSDANLAANTHVTVQNGMAYMAISFGCIALLVIPLFGLLYAGIEGILHSILARMGQTR